MAVLVITMTSKFQFGMIAASAAMLAAFLQQPAQGQTPRKSVTRNFAWCSDFRHRVCT